MPARATAFLILQLAAFPALGQNPDATLPAGVVTLSRAPVPVTVTSTGQAAAVLEAGIRPLVDGVVTEVLYEPGRDVAKGDPLFHIDDATYAAALQSAEADLEGARAALPAAEAAANRAERLAGTGVTQADLDTARVNLLQARAAISVAEAAVSTAQINLDRTTIRSPVNGVPGVPAVSVGDLVTSGQSDALTTVVSLDPIYVDVSESSARILDFRRRFATGDIQPGERLGVSLILENGEQYSGTGTVQTISSTVSTTTGTRSTRFRFDNPDRMILPGMFVTAEVTLGTSQGVLVPQLAATPQPDGTIAVWTVDGEGRSAQTMVTPAGTTRNAWIVTSGIEDGTKLIVDNIDTMTAGRMIEAQDVSITAEGIVTGN
ncbi:efflux RND transporter periplasmic adaptor subunit [Falsirhodobacter xinxiangensis]|uniref:efflux RND transporter periplasmic adaptor subunit n=1 Tax=Falsirhodobacter xinxiangensis TaxID=2530049 RepID=UPI00145AA3EB|nr:efflux RND transporter periplasmic adaptor subunit [Rhodobacter xinxiangensis]